MSKGQIDRIKDKHAEHKVNLYICGPAFVKVFHFPPQKKKCWCAFLHPGIILKAELRKRKQQVSCLRCSWPSICLHLRCPWERRREDGGADAGATAPKEIWRPTSNHISALYSTKGWPRKQNIHIETSKSFILTVIPHGRLRSSQTRGKDVNRFCFTERQKQTDGVKLTKLHVQWV